jgi:choline dehydrogenase-like flavoprotein
VFDWAAPYHRHETGSQRSESRIEPKPQRMTPEYDYIVVGAGSAGCVLAARLSEDPATRVLLLESGPPDRSLWIHLPIGYGKTMWSPTYNWCFETEPEPQMNGRRIYWPRGRTLGGSSSINGLIYVRGQREDAPSKTSAAPMRFTAATAR